jgi:catechol 2,3-dioxygenase
MTNPGHSSAEPGSAWGNEARLDRLRTEAHLSHVALRADDPEALAHFYEESMGFERHDPAPDGALRIGWGRGHYVLELREGRRGVDHFGLEYPRPGGLDEILRRCDEHGIEHHRREGDDAKPESIVVHDPDGNEIELHGRVDRSGERNADPGRRPVRVQHITFASPQMAAFVRFYTEVLDFRVSDHMGEVFTWLRSDREHHSVAVVAGPEADLDHYSYDVDSWPDFKTWCDELAIRNTPIAWGPGRHGPGNNLFVIFYDAAGYRVELSAEMEHYWDDLSDQEPRDWAPGAKTVNLWGPVPSWRKDVTI